MSNEILESQWPLRLSHALSAFFEVLILKIKKKYKKKKVSVGETLGFSPRAWPPQSNPSGARHRPPPRRPGVSWAPPPRRPCYPSCVQLGAPGEKKWHGPEGRARERMNDGCVCTGCRWRVALRGLGRLAPAGLVGASTPPHPAGQGCEQTTPSSINPPARDPRKLGG